MLLVATFNVFCGSWKVNTLCFKSMDWKIYGYAKTECFTKSYVMQNKSQIIQN